ncbi:MAG: hypothetical protein EU551_02580 [Promethearchaeota archaeon]|nr:MAG: hypothetical protein EU551_02580 [Candidatus Lokiarchaeota archaeon]
MIGIYKKGEIDLYELISSIKDHPNINKAGAIVTFTGIMRGEEADKKVERLKIDSYKEMAEKVLKKIVDEEKGNGIIDIQIVHLIGEFMPGEDLVYVVVLGAHRQECFRTIEKVVNRYKTEAPLWKKEILENGKEYWVNNSHKS